MNGTRKQPDPELEALGLTEEDLEAGRFDASEGLDMDDPEGMFAFFDEALKTGDMAFVAKCVREAATSFGMSEVARRAGISRRELYNRLGRLTPRLAEMRPVLDALGARPPDPERAPAPSRPVTVPVAGNAEPAVA